MNKQQYKDRLNQIIFDFEEDKENLEITYSMANNDVEIGDIVTDYCHTVRVENIYFVNPVCDDFPSCQYYGESLTKKLKPHKTPRKETVRQSNNSKIIKKKDGI